MAGEPRQIRVMGEHGGGECLWGDEGLTDGEEYGLSAELRRDLAAFGDRWEANVSPEVTDDRWYGVPVMSQLVSLKYAVLDRRPSVRRAARAESAAMRALGESLAARVQAEVGPAYRVTYVP